MKKKTKYLIRNWKQYNQSLVKRGSLTFWISQDLIDKWIITEKSGERGASRKYSDAAIETMATVKFVFHQAGRQTMGLLLSVFELMKIELSVPDHSTRVTKNGCALDPFANQGKQSCASHCV